MKVFFHNFEFSKISNLNVPDSKIELFGVLNIVLIFVIFSLLNSRFVLSPGVGITLPSSQNSEFKETVGVLTVQSEKFMLFQGEIFSLSDISQGFKKYIREKNLKRIHPKALLIRPDRSLQTGVLIRICELAKEAGYDDVQIATYVDSAI